MCRGEAVFYKIKKGEMLVVVSIIFGCMNDVFSKILGRELPSSEIVFFRFLIGALILIPFMGKRDYKMLMSGYNMRINLLRGILGLSSIWLCTYSVIHLKLVEVTILLWTIPLFELLFCRLFLNNNVDMRQILSSLICFVCVGFFSTNLSEYSPSSSHLFVFPLLAAMFFAFQDIIIKKTGHNSNNDMCMMFSFSAIACIGALSCCNNEWILIPSFKILSCMLGLGICSQLMQYFLFIAFRSDELTNLASIRYVEFAIQLFFGFVFFREVPSSRNIACAIILLLSLGATKKFERKRYEQT